MAIEQTFYFVVLICVCCAGALITFIFFGLHVANQPFANSSLNRTQASTLISLFLNLFLGLLLCLSRYIDLELQDTCLSNPDGSCTGWKIAERRVVEVLVTVITFMVPLVPIFNLDLRTGYRELCISLSRIKSKKTCKWPSSKVDAVNEQPHTTPSKPIY